MNTPAPTPGSYPGFETAEQLQAWLDEQVASWQMSLPDAQDLLPDYQPTTTDAALAGLVFELPSTPHTAYADDAGAVADDAAGW